MGMHIFISRAVGCSEIYVCYNFYAIFFGRELRLLEVRLPMKFDRESDTLRRNLADIHTERRGQTSSARRRTFFIAVRDVLSGAAKSRFIRSTCRGVKPAKIKRESVPALSPLFPPPLVLATVTPGVNPLARPFRRQLATGSR